MTRIVAIDIVADPAAWVALGLPHEPVAADGGAVTLRIGTVALRIRRPGDGQTAAVVGWELSSDAPAAAGPIDGLSTRWVGTSEPAAPAVGAVDPPSPVLRARSIDHLALMTSSLERTCDAIATATGEPLKRIRDAGQVRQGFHRLGEVIVEVVESPQYTAQRASFWGFVLVVDDLDEVCARLGDALIAPPKPAVQPGRRIATFRSAAGLGVPIALISPEVRAAR